MFQSLNQSQIFVGSKQASLSRQQIFELLYLTLLQKVNDPEVGFQRFLELFISENSSLRNLAHQKFNDDK